LDGQRRPARLEVAVEEKMVELWETVLGRPVLPDDDFFLELGGDSLQALQLVDSIVATFGVEVSVADLFERPTASQLASVVQELQARGAGQVG
jgi:acyl carrier protein